MSVALMFCFNTNATNGVAFMLGSMCLKIHLEKSFTMSATFLYFLNISTANTVAFLLKLMWKCLSYVYFINAQNAVFISN